MTHEIKIILSEAEYKALSYIAVDPDLLIDNFAHNRCRIAIEEIVAAEVERITSEGGTLSGTKEDIVIAAQIKSAAEQQAELEQLNTSGTN
jgi:hypothetical protein